MFDALIKAVVRRLLRRLPWSERAAAVAGLMPVATVAVWVSGRGIQGARSNSALPIELAVYDSNEYERDGVDEEEMYAEWTGFPVEVETGYVSPEEEDDDDD